MTSPADKPDAGPDLSGEPKGLPRSSWVRRSLLDGNRLHKWLLVILALAVVGTFGWHLVRVGQLEGQLEEERERLYRDVLGAELETSLRVTGSALGWAASAAMERGDVAAIDDHITSMVKIGPVLHVAVIDADGTVRVATNKKLEGKPAAGAFPGIDLGAAEPTVVASATEMSVIVPLMSNEERLGTALLSYARPGTAQASE